MVNRRSRLISFKVKWFSTVFIAAYSSIQKETELAKDTNEHKYRFRSESNDNIWYLILYFFSSSPLFLHDGIINILSFVPNYFFFLEASICLHFTTVVGGVCLPALMLYHEGH